MLHVDLDALQAVVLVHAQAIGGTNPGKSRSLPRTPVEGVEVHRVVAPAVPREAELEMLLADQALVLNVECIAEERLRKALKKPLGKKTLVNLPIIAMKLPKFTQIKTNGKRQLNTFHRA